MVSIFGNFNWCKNSYLLILLLISTVSCQKDGLINSYPSKVNFEVTGRLLEGKRIDCISNDSKGNTYIGSGKELYYIKGSNQKEYTLDYAILDLAIAPDHSVWIGTNGGGLGHLTEKGFTWFTSQNADLPRDYVQHVKIAPDGKVWFTSCAFRLGGLGIYNGRSFEFLTPDNSPLNQNIIDDIEISEEGAVYIATSGTVGQSNIYRISDNSWKCLGDEKGTFYWVFSFTLCRSGNIFVVEDFSLSSLFTRNKLYQFSNDSWEKIETNDISIHGLFAPVKADKRDYCWMADYRGTSPILNVFNGKTWDSSPENILPDDFVTVIETDSNNNIWVGTFQNGIFILNQ